VEQMASAVSKGAGASANLPGGLRLEVGYDCVTLVREDAGGDAACPYPPAVPDAPLRVPATVPLGGGFAVSAAVGAAPAAFEDSSRWVGHLDPSLARTALRVRSRRPGDRFQPLGMTAPKRLQDFLVDERVPRAWRDRVPLVESDRGIAWIAGCRPAEWARVPEGARRALRLELVGPV
ncbi:MAG: tRNA lysidine(34) synthetase TilS, partial [Gemmatimonadetes bacterium]|nr:tRNA lysidine(34) synthetase TilS [Gemmatimonadota bacterium]